MIKNDLLKIETDDFILSFLGPKPNSNSFALNGYLGARFVACLAHDEIVNIECSSRFGLATILKVITFISKYNLNNTKINVYTSYEDVDGTSYLPLFYENIDYLVQLSPKGDKNADERFELWHEHSSIMNNLHYFKDHSTFSGSFNFRNNVGLSEFLLKQGEKTIMSIKFEVFSLKINFLEDRYYMLCDLSKIKNNIIFKLFNPTKSEGINLSEKASGLEWLVSFYNLSAQLIKIIRFIEKTEHNRLNTEHTICSVNNIKKENKSLTKKINKYGKSRVFQNKNIIIDKRVSSCDTPENRYIKYLLKKLLTITKKWMKHVDEANNDEYGAIKNEHIYISIVSNIRKIEHIYNGNFWNKIGDNISQLENKTNFLFYNEFVQFERQCRKINKAISLETKGNNFIYTLSLDDLYEIWTFCKLAQVVGGIVHNDINSNISLKLKIDAFDARLRTGESSRIRVKDNITIATNRLFKTSINSTYFSPLVSQKPDLVFEIENQNILNIFDAKYRIDFSFEDGDPIRIPDLISEDFIGKIIKIKHKDSDINTMHRYKDAIQTYVDATGIKKLKRAVRKGIILYPYKPYRIELPQILSYLNKIDKFEIGSIPLAPGIEDIDWLKNCNDGDELIFDDSLKYEQIRILANQVKKMINENP